MDNATITQYTHPTTPLMNPNNITYQPTDLTIPQLYDTDTPYSVELAESSIQLPRNEFTELFSYPYVDFSIPTSLTNMQIITTDALHPNQPVNTSHIIIHSLYESTDPPISSTPPTKQKLN